MIEYITLEANPNKKYIYAYHHDSSLKYIHEVLYVSTDESYCIVLTNINRRTRYSVINLKNYRDITYDCHIRDTLSVNKFHKYLCLIVDTNNKCRDITIKKLDKIVKDTILYLSAKNIKKILS